jgi:serine/threonine protein kinase
MFLLDFDNQNNIPDNQIDFCPVVTWSNLGSFTGRPLFIKGKYLIISTLKSGGMGSVYIAKDLQTHELVAIKTMPLPDESSRDIYYAIKQLNKEAEILSRLKHPGIPKFIEFFNAYAPNPSKLFQYLVMSYIEGKDLETIMIERQNTPLKISEILDIFMQILDILTFLHNKKPSIIYRDLKPSNIMIRETDKRVFLVDFGIADENLINRKSIIIGTPGYSPPEQYTGYSNEKSDLYSLGAVIYYLLTGIDPEDKSRPPFHFEPLSKINTNIPKFLETIIMSMLQSDASNRPTSAKRIIQMILRQTKSESPDSLNKINYIGKQNHKKDFLGRTPAHIASISGDKQKIFSCSQEGIDLDNYDIFRMTPIHYAVKSGQSNVVKVLIEEGACINVYDWRNRSPLFIAVENGYKEIVEILLINGAIINDNEKNNTTPIHESIRRGFIEITELLLRYCDDIDIRDSRDETPLFTAVRFNQKNIIENLINKGANVNAKNHKSFTPLTIANMKIIRNDIVKLLVNHGANGKNFWQLLLEYVR